MCSLFKVIQESDPLVLPLSPGKLVCPVGWGFPLRWKGGMKGPAKPPGQPSSQPDRRAWFDLSQWLGNQPWSLAPTPVCVAICLGRISWCLLEVTPLLVAHTVCTFVGSAQTEPQPLMPWGAWMRAPEGGPAQPAVAALTREDRRHRQQPLGTG